MAQERTEIGAFKNKVALVTGAGSRVGRTLKTFGYAARLAPEVKETAT